MGQVKCLININIYVYDISLSWYYRKNKQKGNNEELRHLHPKSHPQTQKGTTHTCKLIYVHEVVYQKNIMTSSVPAKDTVILYMNPHCRNYFTKSVGVFRYSQNKTAPNMHYPETEVKICSSAVWHTLQVTQMCTSNINNGSVQPMPNYFNNLKGVRRDLIRNQI